MPESFNIPLLLFQTFGPRGIPINQPYGQPDSPSFEKAEPFPELPEFDSTDQNTFFGLQKSLGAVDLLGRPLFMPTALDGKLLPNEPVIQIDGGYTLVRTNMSGSDENQGSVKELMQRNDYKITLRGIVINQKSAKNFPEDDFVNLTKICVKGQRMSIDNALCALLGIYDIVIEDFSFPHTPSQNAQAFEINMYSDELFQLIIEN